MNSIREYRSLGIFYRSIVLGREVLKGALIYCENNINMGNGIELDGSFGMFMAENHLLAMESKKSAVTPRGTFAKHAFRDRFGLILISG